MLATTLSDCSPPSVERHRFDLDAAHVAAHALWERGTPSLGRRVLSAWLDGHEPSSAQRSRLVHVHWHLLLFELPRGRFHEARARFYAHVLPAVHEGEDALTDAPSALWWLDLSDPDGPELPWAAVRARAESSLRRNNEPWIEVHNLLAVAGARDRTTLDEWLCHHAGRARSRAETSVVALAEALRAYVSGDYAVAAAALDPARFHAPALGGSEAQNELFSKLRGAALARAEAAAGN